MAVKSSDCFDFSDPVEMTDVLFDFDVVQSRVCAGRAGDVDRKSVV